MSIQAIYNTIATEFDRTRKAPWPCVDRFLSALSSRTHVLDIGCGNGRHMAVRPTEIAWTGIDISESLVSICKQKGFNVFEASMTALPFANTSFDATICIAAYHHLQTDTERAAALAEVWRVLRPGGHHFLTVWAMEQPAGSKFQFTEQDSLVPWKSADGTVHQRYYRIYAAGELEAEIRRLEPRLTVTIIGIEAGNWYAMLSK